MPNAYFWGMESRTLYNFLGDKKLFNGIKIIDFDIFIKTSVY